MSWINLLTYLIGKQDMSFCSTKSIILLILMACLEKTSSDSKVILRRELPKKVPLQRSYADLLNSLIKVNQERVIALKKLYFLNSVTYGKDVLRSTIENKLEDYDKIQERLIRTLKYILDDLEQAPKSIDENDVNAILRDHDHIFVLPIENYNNKEQESFNRNALRNRDSDDSSKENDNDKSESKDDSKSTSSEKFNRESLNEVKGNDTQSRSFYFYGCGRGRLRCIRACKEAYREACDYYYCGSSLRSSLRSACKSECISWFY